MYQMLLVLEECVSEQLCIKMHQCELERCGARLGVGVSSVSLCLWRLRTEVATSLVALVYRSDLLERLIFPRYTASAHAFFATRIEKTNHPAGRESILETPSAPHRTAIWQTLKSPRRGRCAASSIPREVSEPVPNPARFNVLFISRDLGHRY